MKEYDTYIFDFDGTIVDSEASLFPVFKAAFAEIGREVTREESNQYIHISLGETMALTKIEGEDRQRFMDSILVHLDDPESIAMIRFFPEAEEVFKELLARGKKIGIGSNNVVKHMNLVLDGLNGRDYFMTIVGSDRVAHAKPAPDIMYLACEDLGVPCNEKAVYVGDSLQDVATGLASGADGILVDRRNEHPDFDGKRISSLKELLL